MYLGYCRCSTDDQIAGSSLAGQERRVRSLAVMKSAETFDFASYVDEGVSGSIPLGERPAGARLLRDAKSGDVIVAAKLDRLFRSASDALTMVEALAKRGVKVILVDISTEPVTDNGVAKLFFSILASIAEFERARILERTEEGRRAKRAAGGCLGAVPYGYRKIGEGKQSRLELEPQEQEVMALVLTMRRSRLTPGQVARKLNKAGVQTRRGKPWDPTQIKRIAHRGHRELLAERGMLKGMESVG